MKRTREGRALLRTPRDDRRRIPEKYAFSSAKKEIKRDACLECRRDKSDVACVCARASMRRRTPEISPCLSSSFSLLLVRRRSCLSIYVDFGRAPGVTRQPHNGRLTFHASITSLEKDPRHLAGPKGARANRRRAVFLVAIATGERSRLRSRSNGKAESGARHLRA